MSMNYEDDVRFIILTSYYSRVSTYLGCSTLTCASADRNRVRVYALSFKKKILQWY